MRLIIVISTLCLSIVSITQTAQASEENPTLEQLTGAAELVFQGAVQNIEYQPSIEGIPHTFVTYKVEDVIQGQYTAPTITLRFVGGYMQRGEKVIRLQVSHAPKFNKGEQGVLMVTGNGSQECPLVGCTRGRFQFSNGYVADSSGELLALDTAGKLRNVPNHLKQKTIKPSEDYRINGGGPSPEKIDGHAVPIDRDSFVARLRNLGNRPQAGASKIQTVVSADPRKPFKGPRALAESAPAESSGVMLPRQVPAKSLSELNSWEEQELLKNGGNPVLRNQYPGKIRK